MTTTTANPSTSLDSVLDTVRANAVGVDAEGRFPVENVGALGRAGLLGLTSAAEVGGGGQGMRVAAEVVERLAAECGSTAMVLLMHYATTATIEAHGPAEVRREIAGGRHLTTLAFSEFSSRSHFWTPLGTAAHEGDTVLLNAHKSWVTSAGHADSYVWSSLPMADGAGPMTLWLVPRGTSGLAAAGDFDGLGLRGNGVRRAAGRRGRGRAGDDLPGGERAGGTDRAGPVRRPDPPALPRGGAAELSALHTKNFM